MSDLNLNWKNGIPNSPLLCQKILSGGCPSTSCEHSIPHDKRVDCSIGNSVCWKCVPIPIEDEGRNFFMPFLTKEEMQL